MGKKHLSRASLCGCIVGVVIGGIILHYVLNNQSIFSSTHSSLKCVVSSVDGNVYCVRNKKNLNKSADLLAKAVQKCVLLVDYMQNTYPDDPRTIRLVANFNPNTISETLPTDELTAYSENKGEKMAFCLNKTKNGDRPIGVDTLTFVAIHELAHIATVSLQHKTEYWTNFKFLLEKAKEGGIYYPVDYGKTPVQYCGMHIGDNPYYDF